MGDTLSCLLKHSLDDLIWPFRLSLSHHLSGAFAFCAFEAFVPSVGLPRHTPSPAVFDMLPRRNQQVSSLAGPVHKARSDKDHRRVDPMG